MSMILDAFVGKCVEKILNFVEEKAVLILGVKEELKRLQRKLVRIQKVLEDAERRSFEESAINNWVNELKDVMYDADDILDLCMIEDPRLLDDMLSPPHVSRNRSFFSFCINAPHRHEIGERIKSLNDRLDEIYKDRTHFNLDQAPKTRVSAVNCHQTSPVVPELEVAGREIEEATKDLTKMITVGEVKRCSVYAITGMGGIGKTTLAQKIFNHRDVQSKFQVKVWVCVSQTYNEIELLKQMIRDAKASYGEANTKAELQPLLQSAFLGKTLFLVLDDVWRADVWIDLLRSPIQSTHIYASVLITSRDNSVAKQMGSAHIHPVMQLPVDTGWEMLSRRLVTMGGKEEEICNLKKLGLQIVEKCSGLPLAIKVMAGVLAKREPIEKQWKKVLDSDAWSMRKLPEELRGALYLSYDDLPSSLKQCFLYCSLFPEDCTLSRDDLVVLWVAEGFIEDQLDSSMEDKAEEYYYELTRRNLLQSHPLNYDGSKCKIHDLLRSLAQVISGDETFSVHSVYNKSAMPLTKFRRISITAECSDPAVLGLITEQRCLRTLIVFTDSQALDYNKLGIFLHLRVLDLTKSDIKVIPTAIGDLFHLRLLDLDRTLIRTLPESIANLVNLQFLHLRGCKYLTNLPQRITGLKNLRRLALSNTPLDFIPVGIERLKKLNDLRGFVVGGEEISMESTLESVSTLSNLRILHISKLERAQPGSFVPGVLSELKELQLSCTPGGDVNEQRKTANEISLIKDLFEEAVPPRSLEKLDIKWYFGNGYPKWIMSLSLGSYLPFISVLNLVDNMSCTVLPPLGQLPQLKVLFIAGANAVKQIGPEFLGRGVASSTSPERTAFPKLQLLKMERMPNLEEWHLDEEEDGAALEKLVLLPSLHALMLTGCRKLRALPRGLERSSLKKLYVEGADCLKEVGSLPDLAEWMGLHGNKSLERIANLPRLKCLAVSDCCGLKFVEGLSGLQEMELVDSSMNRLPGWLSCVTEELQRVGKDANGEDDFFLRLECNEEVLRRCRREGEDWPIIQQIQRLNAYVHGGEAYLRFVKQPMLYETNI